jgi:hypothetical protein
MDDGTWLALLGAGAMMAAGATRRRRGSGMVTRLHPQIDKVSDQQLKALGVYHDWRSDEQRRARAKAFLQQHAVDPQADGFWEDDVWRQRIRRREAWLSKRFGGDVGLNADWSVSAWRIDDHDPRYGYQGQRYVIDNEDDTYSVVQRFQDPESPDETEIREIVTFNASDFGRLQRWIKANIG